MIINMALRKYLMLRKKYGHDTAIKKMTKHELKSIYLYCIAKEATHGQKT